MRVSEYDFIVTAQQSLPAATKAERASKPVNGYTLSMLSSTSYAAHTISIYVQCTSKELTIRSLIYCLAIRYSSSIAY